MEQPFYQLAPGWALWPVVVPGFRSSSGLAAAYGVAVSTTFVITTLLAY